MTRDKRRKQATRERQKITGEPYSVARREAANSDTPTPVENEQSEQETASPSATRDPLPEPNSFDLEVLLPTAAHRALYGYLYERQDDPPTMREIRAFAAERLGVAHSQTDRRVRDLRDHFHVPAEPDGPEHRYRLAGWSLVDKAGSRRSIGRRLRAQVLAPQRCAQCGRTPLDHGVVLDVDHKVPREWGGTDDLENLQPLCEECNAGKKDHYATYDEHSAEIRAAANHPEPHGRIGELLKAFKGDWVPSAVLGVVASMQQYQEDWQKRLRELRTLGWRIETKKRKDAVSGRFETWYRVTHWEPWPAGSIRAEVTRREKAGASGIMSSDRDAADRGD